MGCLKMSADEDTELRDLVAQNLENSGVLGKIRAELRASVFLSLEQESKHTKIPIVNSELKDYIATREGTMVASIVREFLEFYDLDFSLVVFEPESGFSNDKYEGRQKVATELHITETENSSKRPLLSEILKRLFSGNGDFQDDFSHNKSNGGFTNDISSEQIAEVRKKFDKFDILHRGVVSKQEMKKIFVELFPGFRKGILESFVEDELDHLNKGFNDSINFSEFLTIYKTLYFQCRSVVFRDGYVGSEEKNTKANSGNINKNIKLDEKKKQQDRLILTKSVPQHFDDFTEIETDDPFFDDPLPSEVRTKSSIVNGILNEHEEQRRNEHFQDKQDSRLSNSNSGGTYLSTLSDLPSLSGKSANLGKDNKASLFELSKNINSIHPSKRTESKIIENNIDGSSHEGDYEDDFQSSASQHSGGKSEAKSVSVHSIEEEIHEEIEELSLEVDDLLNDSPHGLDDLTTDRTLSPPSGVGFDYMEDVILHQSASL